MSFGRSTTTGPGRPFDPQRFEPAFFAHLERRIAQLGELGIAADLILFHPYDRWGYATLGAQADGTVLKEGAQVVLGANDCYIGLCRRHWKSGDLGPDFGVK